MPGGTGGSGGRGSSTTATSAGPRKRGREPIDARLLGLAMKAGARTARPLPAAGRWTSWGGSASPLSGGRHFPTGRCRWPCDFAAHRRRRRSSNCHTSSQLRSSSRGQCSPSKGHRIRSRSRRHRSPSRGRRHKSPRGGRRRRSRSCRGRSRCRRSSSTCRRNPSRGRRRRIHRSSCWTSRWVGHSAMRRGSREGTS